LLFYLPPQGLPKPIGHRFELLTAAGFRKALGRQQQIAEPASLQIILMKKGRRSELKLFGDKLSFIHPLRHQIGDDAPHKLGLNHPGNQPQHLLPAFLLPVVPKRLLLQFLKTQGLSFLELPHKGPGGKKL
jgi:hypothetical protein